MKKLLVLALVLTVSTFASATYIITYDDVASTINIETDAAGGPWQDYFVLLVNTADATLGTSAVVSTTFDSSSVFVGEAASDYIAPPAGQDGIVGSIGSYSLTDLSGQVNQVVLSGISISVANEPAVLTLYNLNGDTLATTYESELTIGAVPEPITVALLGLGGLFIRRRK